jgi:antitoxin ParD1/3/4
MDQVLSDKVIVTLADDEARMVADQIAADHYKTPAEVIRAALTLLEDNDPRLLALQAALIEGEESGPSQPFDFDAFLAERRASGRQDCQTKE